jgi:hypothetical protein
MPRRTVVSARAFFEEGFLRRLEPDGWRPLAADVGRVQPLIALSKPLAGDFTAVAELRAMARGDARSFPVDLFALDVGVAYEPLRRLWPLLGTDFFGALVSDDAAQLLGVPRAKPQIIDFPEQADPVIEELASLVPPATDLLAKRLMSIDALLIGLRLDPLKNAALLAATGRFDDAAKALSRFVPIPNPFPERRVEEQHTINQLKGWIETRNESSLSPAPMFHPPAIPPTPPLRRRIPVIMGYIWRRYLR